MRSAAAHLLQDVGDRLLVLTVPAPVGPLDRVAAAWASSELLFWDPAALEPDAWTFVGAGEALRIETSGADRFTELKRLAAQAWAGVVERCDPQLGEVPPQRFFGGLSFVPRDPDGAWAGFSQASFTLPRWTYGRRREQAFLRIALRPDEVRQPDEVLSQLSALLDGLEATPQPTPGTLGQGRLEELPFERWSERIQAALAGIRAGAFEKVVAARRSHLTVGREIDVPALLNRMGASNPEAARFAFTRGEAAFVGATPERLVIRQGDQVQCDALAGSRARAGSDDASGAQALLSSAKDRREHAPVVADIKAVLAPLCARIDAPDVPTVRTLRTVHHLWTPVTAQLAGPTHVLDLVSALHPTPAVSGLPRRAALEWISQNEPEGRGWYAGPVGWFDAEGDGTFFVAIRSAVVRGREAWLYAGGGIVEGSDPAAEYQETALKQGTMLNVLGASL